MSFLCKKLARAIQTLLACIRRVLCFLRPRQQRIGELPYTVHAHSSPPPDNTLAESWHDDWQKQPLGNSVHDQIELYRNRLKRESEAKEEALLDGAKERRKEPDLFQDLQPQFKRPKKILVKQTPDPSQLGSRFAASDNPTLIVPAAEEWGEIEENLPQDQADDWEFDTDSIDTVLKEQKQRERREKHDKRNLEKSKQHSTQRRVDSVRISLSD